MRVALVTGAAGGLGRAVARRLAADGALVAVFDRSPGRELDLLAEEIGGFAVPADVADPEAVREMAAAVEERAGAPIEVLVANAAYMTMAPFTEHDLDDWWRIVDTNLGGTFACVQAVLPGMRARGGGHMVFVASEWGVIGWPGASAYAASKAGLISLAKTLGRELAPEGIAVNAIAPSVIDTPQLEVDARAAGVSSEEIRRRYAERVPLGRTAAPEEIAAAVAHLTDPRMSSLVGQVIHVNGGTTRARA
ncbi:NAD(P)-dependent dehydrogenase, short-chain alcohol dehydrogenase family [Streptosporangium subroseum]|uniref:NAD(P)-dependent dehydrogenase, short-chain alcohol dehydrogenase family n=1 Tax=Streptosporangium subroseum TaxID=106412 RepID=A0A239LEK0_9ACTN|nr:SDR family NAD(P)-dependent oxidoreductase [Streptosporangium subroseum]SNT27964.1 NAD(P)-dependent dehydrogenase, short-chain alcohol dehydrogenase family [Streptosporangium subroseum]